MGLDTPAGDTTVIRLRHVVVLRGSWRTRLDGFILRNVVDSDRRCVNTGDYAVING